MSHDLLVDGAPGSHDSLVGGASVSHDLLVDGAPGSHDSLVGGASDEVFADDYLLLKYCSTCAIIIMHSVLVLAIAKCILLVAIQL